MGAHVCKEVSDDFNRHRRNLKIDIDRRTAALGKSCCSKRDKATDRLKEPMEFRDFFSVPPDDGHEEYPDGGGGDINAGVEALVEHFNCDPGQVALTRARVDTTLQEHIEQLKIDTNGDNCTLYAVRTFYVDNKHVFKIVAVVTAGGLLVLGVGGLVLVPWVTVKALALAGYTGIIFIFTSIKHIIAIGTTCLGGATLYAWMARQYQRLNVREQDELDVRNKFRNAFQNPPKKWVLRKSSHEMAGNERSMMRKLIVDHVVKVHGRAFVYDGSNADRCLHESKPHLYDYSRHIYTDKDAHLPRHYGSPKPGDGVVMIDSDFHRDDLPNVLARNTCYLYTMTPVTAGGKIGNAALCIGPTAENGYDPDAITVMVTGGGTYTHKVWNFSRDHFTIKDPFGRLVCLCEHQRVSQNKSVVMTTAVAWVPWLHWGIDTSTNNLLYITKEASGLQRCKYNTNGVIHISSIEEDGTEVISLALENNTSGVMIEYAFYRSAHSAYRALKAKDNGFSSMVAPVLPERSRFQVDIRILRDIFNALGDEIIPGMAHNYSPPAHTPIMQRPGFLTEEVPEGDQARSIQTACDKNDHEDTKRSGRAIFPAIVPGAVLLDNTRISRENSIKKKVIDIRAKNLMSDERITYWDRVVDLFCDAALIEHKGTVSSLSSEETNEIMNKPTQRAAFERMRETGTCEVLKIGGSAFAKCEPASSAAKCSRAITTAGDEYRHQFSRRTIPLGEVLKRLDFYAPGKTPSQFSARMHERAQVAMQMGLKILNVDASSHDGRRSKATYRVVARLYLYLLTPDERVGTLAFLRMQQGRRIRMTARTYTDIDVIAYWIETTYGSGYPDTSISVTISLIIPAFAAILDGGIEIFHDWNEEPHVRMVTPKEAIEFLVLHGGDDTCDMGVNPKRMIDYCAEFDYVLTVESYGRPDQPHTMLARTFPCLAYTPGSYSDIRRVLSRIHLTCTQEIVTRQEVYARKGLALLTTDPMTPVLGNLGRCLLRSAGTAAAAKVLGQMRRGELNDELSYQARQCVFTDTGYPQCHIDTPNLIEDFINNLGGSPTIVDELCTSLDACDDIQHYTPPHIPGNDWVSPVFSLIGGAVVLAGQGVIDGVPVIGEGLTASYSLYDANWGKKPPIFIPNTHALLRMRGEHNSVIKIPEPLYEVMNTGDTLPGYNTLPRVEYIPDAKIRSRHLGQLKLFLSLLAFDKIAGLQWGKLLLLGSNPCKYLPLLKKILHLEEVHTYDIKRQRPAGSDRHRHSAQGTVSQDNIYNIAREHKGWYVYSDIRRSNGKEPTEEEVHQDNVLGMHIAGAFRGEHLMQKFRCTFDQHEDEISVPSAIFVQPFAPIHSTETRLYYPPGQWGATMIVDKKEYEERMCAFNRVVRPQVFDDITWEERYARKILSTYLLTPDEIDQIVEGIFASEQEEEDIASVKSAKTSKSGSATPPRSNTTPHSTTATTREVAPTTQESGVLAPSPTSTLPLAATVVAPENRSSPIPVQASEVTASDDVKAPPTVASPKPKGAQVNPKSRRRQPDYDYGPYEGPDPDQPPGFKKWMKKPVLTFMYCTKCGGNSKTGCKCPRNKTGPDGPAPN